MTPKFRSSRDVIVRVAAWDRALDFYASVLSLPFVSGAVPRCYIRDPLELVFNIGQTRD